MPPSRCWARPPPPPPARPSPPPWITPTRLSALCCRTHSYRATKGCGASCTSARPTGRARRTDRAQRGGRARRTDRAQRGGRARRSAAAVPAALAASGPRRHHRPRCRARCSNRCSLPAASHDSRDSRDSRHPPQSQLPPAPPPPACCSFRPCTYSLSCSSRLERCAPRAAAPARAARASSSFRRRQGACHAPGLQP